MGEGLGPEARVDARLVDVGGQAPALDLAGVVPGASARCHRVAAPDRRIPQHAGDRIAERDLVHAVDRLHRDEREHREQVALHHVDERARAVVVPDPPLEAERLVVDDLDAFDGVAVPDRLDQPIREPVPRMFSTVARPRKWSMR